MSERKYALVPTDVFETVRIALERYGDQSKWMPIGYGGDGELAYCIFLPRQGWEQGWQQAEHARMSIEATRDIPLFDLPHTTSEMMRDLMALAEAARQYYLSMGTRTTQANVWQHSSAREDLREQLENVFGYGVLRDARQTSPEATGATICPPKTYEPNENR